MDIRCPECGESVAMAAGGDGESSRERPAGRGSRDGAVVGAILGGAAGAVVGAGAGAMADAARSRSGGGRPAGRMKRYTCPACAHAFTAAA